MPAVRRARAFTLIEAMIVGGHRRHPRARRGGRLPQVDPELVRRRGAGHAREHPQRRRDVSRGEHRRTSTSRRTSPPASLYPCRHPIGNSETAWGADSPRGVGRAQRQSERAGPVRVRGHRRQRRHASAARRHDQRRRRSIWPRCRASPGTSPRPSATRQRQHERPTRRSTPLGHQPDLRAQRRPVASTRQRPRSVGRDRRAATRPAPATAAAGRMSRPSAWSRRMRAMRASALALRSVRRARVRSVSASVSVADVPRPLLKSSRCDAIRLLCARELARARVDGEVGLADVLPVLLDLDLDGVARVVLVRHDRRRLRLEVVDRAVGDEDVVGRPAQDRARVPGAEAGLRLREHARVGVRHRCRRRRR